MFAAHNNTNTGVAAGNNSNNNSAESWIDNSHEMLLATNQEVLDYDYTSFSDDSHSPILSLESFSQQHSPELGSYCFPDFDPISSSSASSASALAFQPIILSNIGASTPLVTATTSTKTSADETARQAALLHAYITAQMQQQQQWGLSNVSVMKNDNQQQQPQQQQQKQLPQLDKTQKSDAENLARYLAQMKQIKEEDADMNHQDMDHADVSSASESSPPSPTASSFASERSSSPEAISSPMAKNVNNKTLSSSSSSSSTPSRQLTCYNCNVTQTPLWRRTPDRQHSLCNACGLYYKQYGAHRPLNVRHKLPSVLGDPRASSMPYGRTLSSSSSTRGSSPSGPESSDSESDSGHHHQRSSFRTLPDLTKMYTDALLGPTAAAAGAGQQQKTNPPLMIAKQGIECANCSQTQTPLWRKNEAGEPICNACGLYAKLHNRARPVTMRKSKITRRRRDWGGNLAHQAQAQAQALAQFHAQVQAQVEAQANSDHHDGSGVVEASMVHEMSQKALELNGNRPLSAPSMPSPVHSSDSEEEHPQPVQQQQQQQGGNLAQKLSGNLIMDENKFADMVSQMNAHQMNRFLSILESRCGVLRNRIIANTEGSSQDSSLDSLF
ncbi:hypothetical protein BGZ49_009208 [Haplosporangium sp. Z 27]|nr:hypothetical protein BGZ49_009208 [Haplosporangium sp. Z 27]